MAGDDITAPLGLNKDRDKRRLRIPYGLISAGLLSLVVTFIVVWVMIVEDPLGGQPQSVVALSKGGDGINARDIAVVDVRDKQDGADAAEDDREDLPAADDGDQAADDAATRRASQSSAAQDGRLTVTPISKILEQGRHGPLPKIADDGSRPLDLYAAPPGVRLQSVPKIAIIVGGIGLSQSGSQSAIKALPRGVTLGFAPYGSSLDRWLRRARRDGHEVVLQVPLEPFDFPNNDPGPHTLLTSLDDGTNADRLNWLLSRITNYTGVMNYMGARFSASEESLAPFVSEVTRRGLMLIDDASSSRSVMSQVAAANKTPFARADMVIDAEPSPDDIDTRLLQLEAIARSKGVAVGVASALPVTVKQIAAWAKSIEARGVYLVPVSAIAGNQKAVASH